MSKTALPAQLETALLREGESWSLGRRDDHRVFSNVFDMLGRTPNLRLNMGGCNAAMFLKCEGTNPTGSVKDRACGFILQSALATGVLKPGMTLLDASSGNFACALAFYGKVLGYDSELAVTSKLTAAKRAFLSYLGATVHQVGQFTIDANIFCRKLVDQHPERYYFLDQLHNWGNPEAHLETTGPEILSDFPDVAMVVGSLGSGGTMMGVAQYLKHRVNDISIVVVECAAGSRLPGTGTFVEGDYVTPFIRKGYAEGYFDERVRVTEAEACRVARSLLADGIFCGPQTGGVVHAALTLAAEKKVHGPIVVLSGDTGWKNLDKLLASGIQKSSV